MSKDVGAGERASTRLKLWVRRSQFITTFFPFSQDFLHLLHPCTALFTFTYGVSQTVLPRSSAAGAAFCCPGRIGVGKPALVVRQKSIASSSKSNSSGTKIKDISQVFIPAKSVHTALQGYTAIVNAKYPRCSNASPPPQLSNPQLSFPPFYRVKLHQGNNRRCNSSLNQNSQRGKCATVRAWTPMCRG